MKRHQIPEDVARLIVQQIDSVPHLEALMLLAEDPRRSWTPAMLAPRLYVSEGTAAAILGDLKRQHFAVSDAANPAAGHLSDDVTVRVVVTRVGEVYRRHVAAVATLIHEKGSRSVREFARAFELKKPKE